MKERKAPVFKSFFQAGFECATGFNSRREWIDQIAATRHDVRVEEDYAAMVRLGLGTAREGVRWPLVDRGLRYDFSTLEPILAAAERHGVELVLDLFHYGYPKDLDPFSEAFVERFSDYCYETARFLKDRLPGPHWFTPVNEPSYFSWAAGDAGLFAPYAEGRSFELKVNLIRAAIQGIDAIRGVLPNARMVNADPLCRVVAPRDRPDLADEAHGFNEYVVFQSWDMLAGRFMPELGGSPEHLDVVGLNYYWTNQWEHTRSGIPLAPDDERVWPLRDLIRWVHHRYPDHDLAITETAHSQPNKAAWLEELAQEAIAVLAEGIPLQGACLYPVLGMPEWHDPSVWAHMGLWEIAEDGARTLHEPMAQALESALYQTAPLIRSRVFMS